MGRRGGMENVRGFCVLALFAIFAFGAPAKAEDSPLWSHSGDWEIRVDTTLDYGCFALAGYEEDTVLRIGLDPSEGNGYIMVGDPDWQSLEEGKDYAMRVRFGRATPWEAEASALRLGDLPVLVFRFSDITVIREFMRKREVAFIYRGRTITTLSLSGSYRAFEEVVRCQEQVSAGLIGSGADPFADDPGSSDDSADPFR